MRRGRPVVLAENREDPDRLCGPYLAKPRKIFRRRPGEPRKVGAIAEVRQLRCRQMEVGLISVYDIRMAIKDFAEPRGARARYAQN